MKSFQVLPNEGNGLQSVRVAMAMLFAVNGSVWQSDLKQGPVRQTETNAENKTNRALNTAALLSLIKLAVIKRNILVYRGRLIHMLISLSV